MKWPTRESDRNANSVIGIIGGKEAVLLVS
jgi:hypothetical protein